MGKEEKYEGIPKPSTVKRVDPPVTPRKKAGRNRKEYPPHLEVRFHHWGYDLKGYKIRPSVPFFWLIKGDRPNRKDLTVFLDWYAEHHPHTANLPVRFISCQPVECGREVIPN